MITPRDEPELRQLSEFLSVFEKESDRGAALSAASLLEDRLKEIISSFLADIPKKDELFDGMNAPFATFSSRISTAYALGLLEEIEYQELVLIRKIRNEFGHNRNTATFETPKISNYCARLPWLGEKRCEPSTTPRDKFNVIICMLLCDLLWRARLALKTKRTITQWTTATRSGCFDPPS